MVGKLNLSSNNISSAIHSYFIYYSYTSNEPLDRINQILNEVNTFHPNIKLVRQIGNSVSFMD
jgi:hypothetical protein